MSRLSGISRAGPLCCSASEVEREESVVGRILNTSLRSSKCNIYSTLYNDIIYYPFSFSLSLSLSHAQSLTRDSLILEQASRSSDSVISALQLIFKLGTIGSVSCFNTNVFLDIRMLCLVKISSTIDCKNFSSASYGARNLSVVRFF